MNSIHNAKPFLKRITDLRAPSTLLLAGLLGLTTAVSPARETTLNERLWFDAPGYEWNAQALHLGNAYFGASFFGRVEQEQFTLGEKSFWLGGPGDAKTNDYGIIPGGKDQIAKIRQLIVEGKVREADILYSQTMLGSHAQFGSLSTIGNLYLDFGATQGAVSEYQRALDIHQSLGTVSYKIDGVAYQREYFCSYPDRVLAVRVSCEKAKSVTMEVWVDPVHIKRNPKINVDAKQGLFEISGNIDDNNRPYEVKVKVVNDGGTLEQHENRLKVVGANSAVVYYTVATDYVMTPPLYRGADPKAITAEVIEKVSQASYKTLKERHIADYQSLYLKSALHLENPKLESEKRPTNVRWVSYAQGDYSDVGLQEAVFNFGKYLLISASRPGALPAGLQGAWAYQYTAMCGGNYQVNINIPEIYMPGNVLGLSQCNEPFLKWIEGLVVPGREVAKAYYGTEGWLCNSTGNIWGNANPGGDIQWASFPSGGAWLCRHLWEQYEFNPAATKTKLKEEYYPVMKEAAVFWLANLMPYKGHLVPAPSVSAEHQSPKGYLVPGFQDVALVGDLFDNVIKASTVLGQDASFRKQVAEARAKLFPYQVGRLGQFQEWVEDLDDPRCHHRHFMHLLAVHPCGQINAYQDKKLAEAVKVSMNLRGDNTNADRKDPMFYDAKCTCLHNNEPVDNWTGGNWSLAHKCWIWARLLDGDRANKIACEMLGEAGVDNLCTYQRQGGGARIMQLDGSITTPGFMAEMLLQSQNGELALLPALPKAWNSGSVKGLHARGGFVVDLSWKDGKLEDYRITSAKPGKVRVRINGKVELIPTQTP